MALDREKSIRDRSGVFLSRKTTQAMPTTAAQRLYFTTTNGAELRPREVKDPDENFYEVFEIGKRTTRYMDMPPPGTHMPTWDDVQSRREFHQKPFLDLQENREIAASLKLGQQPLPTFGSEKSSQYTRDFRGPSGCKLLQAQRDPMAAEEEGNGSSRTMGGTGQWMVSSSSSHEHYCELQNAARTRSVPKVRQNIKVTPASAKSWKSQSNRTYVPAPGCAPIASTAMRARPGRVPPRDLAALMDGIKQEMRHSLSAPSGELSVFKRPF